MSEMRDHWWWRPGWKPGRSFYTWHIVFQDCDEARRLVDHYAPLVERFPVLDPVGITGLHLTFQGIGFTDEVNMTDVDQIIESARQRLEKLASFKIRIGPAHVDPETVQMPVTPLEDLAATRLAIRGAIADVWGPDNVPEPADGFRPHVTLAYSNSAGPDGEIRAALHEFPDRSASVEVSHIALIDLNRDSKRYEWTEVASVAIGPPHRLGHA